MNSYEEKSRSLTCINLWAGPGAGKSTTAAGLFYLMKNNKVSVELVSEYAKDLVWSKRHNVLPEQDYLFAKQHHMVRRLAGQVDFAITDSPLPLGLVYIDKDFPATFKPFCLEVFQGYGNINIRLNRVKPYHKVGRNQSQEEAEELDIQIARFMEENAIPVHMIVDGDIDAPLIIFNKLRDTGIITLS